MHVRGDHGSDEKKGKKKKKGPLCYKCFNHGHIKKDYLELKKDEGTASVVIANRKDDSDSDGDLLTVSTEESCEVWLLDSASSFHVIPKKECFLSYTEVDNGSRAYLGDGSAYQVMGVGDIKFKMCDGQEVILKGVRHVPGLTRNLISLGRLHEEGWLYQAAPDKKTLSVMHGGETIMVGEKSGARQYKLQGSVVEGGVMDSDATVVVFCPEDGAAMGSASPDRLK